MPFDNGEDLPDLLLKNLRDYAIFSLDCKRRVAHWNANAQRLFGYTTQEIVGRGFGRLFAPVEDQPRSARECLDLTAKVGRYEDEAWWVRKDRSRFRGQVIFIALRDDRKRKCGFAVVARDISIRAQAIEDRATLAVTYYHAPVGIAQVALDGDGQFLDVNDKFCEVLGYSRDELLRMNVAQITDPAYWARERKLIRQLRNDEIESYSIEKPYRHRHGKTL
jgi:PAS domain S-box-containing protein